MDYILKKVPVEKNAYGVFWGKTEKYLGVIYEISGKWYANESSVDWNTREEAIKLGLREGV